MITTWLHKAEARIITEKDIQIAAASKNYAAQNPRQRRADQKQLAW